MLLILYDKGIFVSHLLLTAQDKTAGIPKSGKIRFLLMTILCSYPVCALLKLY